MYFLVVLTTFDDDLSERVDDDLTAAGWPVVSFAGTPDPGAVPDLITILVPDDRREELTQDLPGGIAQMTDIIDYYPEDIEIVAYSMWRESQVHGE